MKFLGYLSLVSCLACPQVVIAAEPAEPEYTPKKQIKFAPATKAAFDHSGKLLTQSTLADGSLIADHHGSMGNVTVARMGPGGVIETFCTTDKSAARAWMAGEDGTKATPSVSVPLTVRRP